MVPRVASVPLRVLVRDLKRVKRTPETPRHGSRPAMACNLYPAARRAAVFLGVGTVALAISAVAGHAGQKLYDMSRMFDQPHPFEAAPNARTSAPEAPNDGSTAYTCASSLSYLARIILRSSPIGRFDEVASDLVARRDAMKSLSLAFEGRECQLQRGARGCVVGGELQRSSAALGKTWLRPRGARSGDGARRLAATPRSRHCRPAALAVHRAHPCRATDDIGSDDNSPGRMPGSAEDGVRSGR